MKSDSKSGLQVGLKRGLGRLKHMDIRYLSLQDEVRSGNMELQFVPGLENVADMLTKPLTKQRFQLLCHKVGMIHQDDGEQEIDMITVEPTSPPVCHNVAMRLQIDSVGMASWVCSVCFAVLSWPEYLVQRGQGAIQIGINVAGRRMNALVAQSGTMVVPMLDEGGSVDIGSAHQAVQTDLTAQIPRTTPAQSLFRLLCSARYQAASVSLLSRAGFVRTGDLREEGPGHVHSPLIGEVSTPRGRGRGRGRGRPG